MTELPDDLITAILLRLPVKPLLRFRCVSKPYCALIDSTNFVKKHLNRTIQTKNNHHLILEDTMGKCPLYSLGLSSLGQTLELVLPINPKQLHVNLVGSCNGLLCLSYGYSIDVIIIWNPATQKHVKLPSPNIKTRLPYDCSYMLGFGYDSVSNDYKVVLTVQHIGNYDFPPLLSEATVYSLMSNLWGEIQDCTHHLTHSTKTQGVLACGALHWVAWTTRKTESPNLIATFDLATEEHRWLTLPDYLFDARNSDLYDLSLSELGGCLSITWNKSKVGVVDVWVMKVYGVRESWTKLLVVSDPEGTIFVSLIFPVAYSENGDDVLLKKYFSSNYVTKLLWYNLEKKTIMIVDVCGLPEYFNHLICLESLVSFGKTEDNEKNQGGKMRMKNQGEKLRMKKQRIKAEN